MSHPLPPKKEVALALLERSSVHVHLDPRAAGVVVPLFLKSQPQLVLQIGLNMPVPIPDLRLDEAGMTCTLSFNRAPFYCVIPWTSIFAMIGDDGRGMIWKDDVPPEVAKPSQARPDRPAVAPAEIAGRPLRAAPNPPDSEAGAAGGKRAGDAKGGSGAGAEGRVKVAKKPRKRVERASTKEPRAGTAGTAAGAGSASEGRSGANGREGKEARGGLSAVPSLPASTGEGAADRPARKSARDARDPGRDAGAGSATEKRPAARPAAAPTRDEMPPPPAPRPSAPRRPGGPPRVKRELPPYLRVVK